MNKGVLSFIFFLTFSISLFAENEGNTDRQQYIDKWKKVAMKQMKLHGIPASITLAQGILESRNGQSTLTKKSNNHFGIKCHDWKGKKVYADDDKKNECFRKYKNADESFEDHSQFLLRKRYAGLFELKKSDYKGWAKGLRKAGYATDPAYAKLLIKLIEENNLHQYDKMVLKGKYEPAEEEVELIAEKPAKVLKEKREVLESGAVINLVQTYKIKRHSNNIKYVVAKEGDSVEDVAEALDMAYWQISRYNDLGSRKKLKEGEVLFIQPKRKSNKKGTHKVKDGDTLLSISQLYGIKLKKLAAYNELKTDAKIKSGATIKLKK